MKLSLKSIFVPNGQKRELTATEVWVVRWRSRNGQYNGDTRDEAEVFVSEDDAKKFKEELKEAFKLIKHTSGTRVEITKN